MPRRNPRTTDAWRITMTRYQPHRLEPTRIHFTVTGEHALRCAVTRCVSRGDAFTIEPITIRLHGDVHGIVDRDARR